MLEGAIVFKLTKTYTSFGKKSVTGKRKRLPMWFQKRDHSYDDVM